MLFIHLNIGYNKIKLFGLSFILYSFTSKKSYAYLLNAEPSSLVFLETYNTEFDAIIRKFTNQNGRPLEIEDKLNLTLLINK